MKTLSILALVSAVGLAAAALFSAVAAAAFFTALGIAAIAGSDYVRERRPLCVSALTMGFPQAGRSHLPLAV